MYNEKMVSFIIPVHNVEQYVERCVRSIADQDYKALEILLVENGSSDGSLAACERLAREDARIKVIQSAVTGVSIARNLGIERASGDYLMFADADDWLAQGAVTDAVSRLEKSAADVAFFDYFNSLEKTDSSPRPVHLAFPSNQLLDSATALTWMLEGRFYWNVWQTISKRELFASSSVRFPKGIYVGEDLYFTYHLIGAARQIAFLDKAYYGYFQRPDSMMGKARTVEAMDKRLCDTWDMQQKLWNYTVERFPMQLNAYAAFSARSAFVDLISIGLLNNKLINNKWQVFLEEKFVQYKDSLNYRDLKNRIRIILVQFKLLHIRTCAVLAAKCMRGH